MKRKDDALWKVSATPEEAREVKRMDRELDKLRKQAFKIHAQRYVLTNRLTVRTRSRRCPECGEQKPMHVGTCGYGTEPAPFGAFGS